METAVFSGDSETKDHFEEIHRDLEKMDGDDVIEMYRNPGGWFKGKKRRRNLSQFLDQEWQTFEKMDQGDLTPEIAVHLSQLDKDIEQLNEKSKRLEEKMSSLKPDDPQRVDFESAKQVLATQLRRQVESRDELSTSKIVGVAVGFIDQQTPETPDELAIGKNPEGVLSSYLEQCQAGLKEIGRELREEHNPRVKEVLLKAKGHLDGQLVWANETREDHRFNRAVAGWTDFKERLNSHEQSRDTPITEYMAKSEYMQNLEN